MQITALFILEVINIAVALVFLALFIYRIKYLSHFAQTDKYLNYYPKIRIFFCLIYVALSIALLSYNIAIQQYPSQVQQYLFAGGGGQMINAVILLVQLGVLRQQLKKQRPYAITHVIYFFYLVIISIVRFGITISLVVQKQSKQIVDLALSTCLMADSCIQLGYWIAKKQTLPQFQSNNYFSFDQFKLNQNPRLVSRNDISGRIQQKSYKEDFPYIQSTVKIQNGKFKIILQIFVSNRILPQNLESTDLGKLYTSPSEIKAKNVSQVLRASMSRSHNVSKGSFHLQIISQHFYNIEQVKQLYLLCGRFPLKSQIKFNQLPSRQIAKSLQIFLDQIFQQKCFYQQFLLKYFHLDKQFLQIFAEKTKNFEDNFVSQKNSLMTVDRPSHFDKNCIFMSIQIYRQLWIQDHYQFYMKVSIKQTMQTAYPMRRYSEFEDFNNQLQQILNDKLKNSGYLYQLPQLPKKHLFHWDQQKIKHRRYQLELFLRKLCNDPVLMEIGQARELILRFLNFHNKILHISPVYEQNFYDQVKVIKGDTSKALIQNDYVTFYEFKLFRQGIQIRGVKKRFSDFVTLNQDISRWMNNIQICYKNIVLPEKHLYKSQAHRHQKLRNYLQSIINIKQSYQIYPLNVFFNIAGNTQLSDDSLYSAISFVKSKTRLQHPFESSRKTDQIEMIHNNQAQLEKSPTFSFSSDLRRMSYLIDQLGNDDLE